MPTAADLRLAITAANTGTADAAQQIMLADAAATLLPDPVTISKYFVLFAWLDGSRRWQPGYEPYDSLDLANGAAAIKQASTDYANVTVSSPLAIVLPGAGPVVAAVATTATPDVAASGELQAPSKAQSHRKQGSPDPDTVITSWGPHTGKVRIYWTGARDRRGIGRARARSSWPQNNMDSVAVSCYRDLEMENAPPKTNRGRFKKGQSGNPGGRPKMPPDMKAAIQEKTRELLKSLFALARQKADPRVQAVAIKELLDRGWGRAVQTVNAKVEGVDANMAHLEALRSLMDATRSRSADDEDDPPELSH